MWLTRNPELGPMVNGNGTWWPDAASLKEAELATRGEHKRMANICAECNRPAALNFTPKQDLTLGDVYHCFAACNVCYKFPICQHCIRSCHPADLTRKFRYCSSCWHCYIEHCSYCGKQSTADRPHRDWKRGVEMVHCGVQGSASHGSKEGTRHTVGGSSGSGGPTAQETARAEHAAQQHRDKLQAHYGRPP